MTKSKSQPSLLSCVWQARVSYLMLAPFLLFFFLLLLLPILISVVLSFTSYDFFNRPVFVGFDNFITLFVEDSEFVTALENTLLFALITGPMSYILCFFIAWLINDQSRTMRSVITFIFYAPSISGSLYTIWSVLLSSDRYGMINGFLMQTGLIREPLLFLKDPAMILPCLIIIQLWMSMGTGFLSFVAGFQMINRDLFEVYITLPQMKPMLLFGAITQIVGAFSAGDVSLRLCGFPSVNNAGLTITLHAYDYANLRYEMGYGCAISLLLFIIMYLMHKLIHAVLNRIGR